MRGWGWDEGWELLLHAPGGISALWSSVEQNCHVWDKKMAEGYKDSRVQINEKGFGGKRYLKEV